MNEQECDERYIERDIENEIRLLQIFRDIDFYNVEENFYKSCHKKADITGTVGSLGRILEDCSNCETFGELNKLHPELYKIAREDLLLCMNKFYYAPRDFYK